MSYIFGKSVKWTPDEIKTFNRMTKMGYAPDEIAKRLGRTKKAITARLEKIRNGERRGAIQIASTRSYRAGDKTHEPPRDILIARDEYVTAPRRDLTGILQGDPPIGFSALDRKIAMGKA